MIKNYFIKLVIFTMLFYSCDDSNKSQSNKSDYSNNINKLTNNVVIATYQNLKNESEKLVSATKTFQTETSISNLEALKLAWVKTREPWELSEAFLFGPVATEGIDPLLDSWPVNRKDLENVIKSQDALNQSYVSNLEGTLRGFHIIELLIWGEQSNKKVDEFTVREIEYLIVCSEILNQDISRLLNEWTTDGNNFGRNLLTAGESESIYISQKSVLEEFANGMLIIVDELGNGKINNPLELENFTLEESQFSDNSKLDFVNNIQGVKNVYLNGFTDLVAFYDKSIDERIKTELDDAIQSILDIPGTFTQAIPKNSNTRIYAITAQEKVKKLQSTLQTTFIPLISNL